MSKLVIQKLIEYIDLLKQQLEVEKARTRHANSELAKFTLDKKSLYRSGLMNADIHAEFWVYQDKCRIVAKDRSANTVTLEVLDE